MVWHLYENVGLCWTVLHFLLLVFSVDEKSWIQILPSQSSPPQGSSIFQSMNSQSINGLLEPELLKKHFSVIVCREHEFAFSTGK